MERTKLQKYNLMHLKQVLALVQNTLPDVAEAAVVQKLSLPFMVIAHNSKRPLHIGCSMLKFALTENTALFHIGNSLNCYPES